MNIPHHPTIQAENNFMGPRWPVLQAFQRSWRHYWADDVQLTKGNLAVNRKWTAFNWFRRIGCVFYRSSDQPTTSLSKQVSKPQIASCLQNEPDVSLLTHVKEDMGVMKAFFGTCINTNDTPTSHLLLTTKEAKTSARRRQLLAGNCSEWRFQPSSYGFSRLNM